MMYRREMDSQTVELEADADITEATAAEFRAAMYAELDKPHRKSSRPGEFHPQPLSEPYVTVSRHTALVTHP